MGSAQDRPGNTLAVRENEHFLPKFPMATPPLVLLNYKVLSPPMLYLGVHDGLGVGLHRDRAGVLTRGLHLHRDQTQAWRSSAGVRRVVVVFRHHQALVVDIRIKVEN